MICRRNSGAYPGRVLGIVDTSSESMKISTKLGQLHLQVAHVPRTDSVALFLETTRFGPAIDLVETPASRVHG